MIRQAPAPPAAEWESVGRRDAVSWYLDPVVAEQKRRLHAGLVPRDLPPVRVALKTDAFEEAYGEDSPLSQLLSVSKSWIVIDHAAGILARAKARTAARSIRFLASDVRRLSVRTGGVDMILSNSTLDHFESTDEFDAAVGELARVLKPRGMLVLTTDNPLNPGYWLLRGLCRTRFAPFPLGYTPGPRRLNKVLEGAGFEIARTGVMIHNPRGFSTLLFLAMRRLLGTRADRPIRGALAAFEVLGRLPTRRLTGCFLTVHAVRRP